MYSMLHWNKHTEDIADKQSHCSHRDFRLQSYLERKKMYAILKKRKDLLYKQNSKYMDSTTVERISMLAYFSLYMYCGGLRCPRVRSGHVTQCMHCLCWISRHLSLSAVKTQSCQTSPAQLCYHQSDKILLMIVVLSRCQLQHCGQIRKSCIQVTPKHPRLFISFFAWTISCWFILWTLRLHFLIILFPNI